MQRHSIVSFGLIVTALMVTVAGTAFAFECSPAVKARARDFIDNEKQFHLGFLPTEQSNPITATLEEDFKRSTLAGVQCLQRGDRQIPITMRHVFASAQYRRLVDAMAETLQAPKGRIIFSGCGATGRLSILLESMWRDFFHRRAAELTPEERALADRSASIMTSGDFALIKSVESFEDSMAGGERQAADLCIGDGDTFVAITEGGETSSVLGTLRYAAAHGAKCFLVFNNPADLLRARLDRCREAIDNPKVTVIDLYCGSMSLAGSTRMQATTSEQLLGSCALEAALCRVLPRFAKESAPDCTVAFEKLLSTLESPASRANIAAAIDFEKALYARKGRITYFADDCMLDLFTDTTERSPTFMLPPFRSTDEDALAPSWAFVKNPLYDTEACWQALFHRNVRCLEWTVEDYAAPGMPVLRDGNPPKIGRRFLMKYPIGREDTPKRYADGPSAAVIVRAGAPDAAFESAARAQSARFGETRLFAVAASDPSPLEVWKHLAVKLTFNNLSTGTMAAMGRVAGNWMSWVSISNKKLIDRGIRLISELGRIPYEEAAQRLFAADEWIQSQDWTSKETPCAVQVALKELRVKGEASRVGAVGLLDSLGFTLHMSAPVTNAVKKMVSSEQMRTRTVKEKDGKTCIVWRGHPLCGDNFTVTAALTPTSEKDGWSYEFCYSGNESGLGVRLIEFPVLTVPRTDKTEIFYPQMCGQIRRPKWADVKPGANVAVAAMNGIHFMAALNGTDESWYADQRGDARVRPNWSIVRNGKSPQTVTMLFRYAPPLTPANRIAGALPFGGTIRRFKGDWFAAAEIYRRWAWEQPWAKAAFARPQKEMRNIAIWFWNRGLIRDVVPPVERFAKETGLPVALDWYWWHEIPYDACYPFFWPPREGAEAFAATVRRLVAQGIFVQPYTNGISWDWAAEGWETDGCPDAIMREDGSIPEVRYNSYMPNNRLSEMCGCAPHFHRHMRGLMRTLRAAGLPGVYMDQVGGCCTVKTCWNPDHPHPPGGGTVITDGYRKLFRDIKADNPGFCISTEDTPEAYLDIVDSSINLWQNGERFGMPAQPEAETVPAFMAVYHGALAVYGSYAVIDGIPPWDPKWPDTDKWQKEEPWETLYPDQYALEFARGVAMGMQPMVHQLRMRHFDDSRYAGNFKFTVDTAKFYHANRDFLYDGTMCAPGTLTCARQPVELFIRGIYTKRDKARVVRHPSHSTILHSVWRAKDGRVAAILCNWSRKEQPYNLVTPDIAAVGTIPARSWKLIEKQERNEK